MGKQAIRLKLKLSTEQVNVANVRVFISYSSQDLDVATHIEYGLSNVGFKTYLLKSTDGLPQGESDVSEYLSKVVEDADYVCVVVSDNSGSSDWVRYEVKQALQLIGRVVLGLTSPECAKAIPAIVGNLEPDASSYPPLRHLKYSTVLLSPREKSFRFLAETLINDPDEGVFLEDVKVAEFARRDLRREGRMRRYARMYAGVYPKYQQKYIIEVLPFFWEEIGVELGDSKGALDWFVANRGRADLIDKLVNDQVDIFCHSMGSADFPDGFTADWMGSLVVTAIPPYPFSHREV
jgi:hypothetical protein